jgi:hypothetical protein
MKLLLSFLFIGGAFADQVSNQLEKPDKVIQIETLVIARPSKPEPIPSPSSLSEEMK